MEVLFNMGFIEIHSFFVLPTCQTARKYRPILGDYNKQVPQAPSP